MRNITSTDAILKQLQSEDRQRRYELLGDGILLTNFMQTRDDDCFAELLRRHGPMVWGICRRVLGTTHDADDAFQAVFLVLLRKAPTLKRVDLLSHWLCAVAFKTAKQARRRLNRLGQREQQQALPEGTSLPPTEMDWLPLFDAALHRLPAKYREPVVLCELQGLSRSEAARRLQLNEGTLSSRLGRARDMLRTRLGRFGLPAVLGTALLPTTVPPVLYATTTAAVLNISAASLTSIILMNGVLTTMFLSKVKAISSLAAVCVLGSLVTFTPGTGTTRAHETEPLVVGKNKLPEPLTPDPTPTTAPIPAPIPPPMPPRIEPKDETKVDPPLPKKSPAPLPMADDLKQLQGFWRVEKANEGVATGQLVEIVHDVMLIDDRFMRIVLESNTSPKRIQLKDSQHTKYCIYHCEGDTLTIAHSNNAARVVPVDFEQTDSTFIMTYRRARPEEAKLKRVPPATVSPMVSDVPFRNSPLPEIPPPTTLRPVDLSMPIPPTDINIPAVNNAISVPRNPVAPVVGEVQFVYPHSEIAINAKQFKIPVNVNETRKDAMAIMLMMSSDLGKTWVMAEMVAPVGLKDFTVKVPKTGTYQFAVMIITKDRTMEPASLAQLKPALTVDVVDEMPSKTSAKELELLNQIKQLQERLKQLEQPRLDIPPVSGLTPRGVDKSP